MKVFTAEQIRELDVQTIAEENISPADLMERASMQFSNWLTKKFNAERRFYFFCGTGNNGGDGLCTARHLFLKGYAVQVFIIGERENGSADFKCNLQRVLKFNVPLTDYGENAFPATTENDCIIDAILGSGLNRPVEGLQKQVIENINNAKGIIISIDVPSGFYADKPTTGSCIKADHTFSFEFPKYGFFFPENNIYTGEWIVKPIGLSKKHMQDLSSDIFYTEATDIKKIFRPVKKFDHKGSYGHSLIIAGSKGMEGAAALSGKSCLVTGSGLVTVCSTARPGVFPELMQRDINSFTANPDIDKYAVIGAGPGLGTDTPGKEILETVLRNHRQPLVLDADALNIIAQNPNLLNSFSGNTVLTPHPGEFERLFGKTGNSFDQVKLQKEMSVKYECVIVLKRAFTSITNAEGKVWFNSTGNPGMATAGSGDVLTGMITAFIARKYTIEQAAIIAVYMHGLAGDIAMKNTNGQNIVATDIIGSIQIAIGRLIAEESCL